MKKLLALILTLTLLLCCVPFGAFNITASAATSGTTGDCTWSLNGTVLTISGSGKMGNYSDTSSTSSPWGWSITKVIIQDGVTSIGNYAFYYCYALTSITIPDSVTSIGSSAFEGCSFLTSITIPDSVTSIGGWAFYNCSSLTNITIPDSVTSIGKSAFGWCSSLTSITIGKSVTSIGDYAFYNCLSVKLFSVSADNQNYSSASGVLFNKDKTRLMYYPAAKPTTSYTIPDSVTSIGYDAFYNCSKLTSITIGKSVTSIGYEAFSYCSNLKTVYYRGSETDKSKIKIGSSNSCLTNATWYYNACIGSTEHTYDDENDLICNVCGFKIVQVHSYLTYTETENGAVVTGFKDGISGNVIIPETLSGAPVIAIENMAFVYCENITSVIIPNSVTDIKEYAFYGCSSLEKVTLGNGVKNIGTDAFADCTALKTVAYKGEEAAKELITFAGGNEYLQNAEWQYGELFEPGDVNGDNEINVSDLATLKKYIAGLLTEAEMLTVNPDVDENGTVNVSDLAVLKKNIAGIA